MARSSADAIPAMSERRYKCIPSGVHPVRLNSARQERGERAAERVKSPTASSAAVKISSVSLRAIQRKAADFLLRRGFSGDQVRAAVRLDDDD